MFQLQQMNHEQNLEIEVHSLNTELIANTSLFKADIKRYKGRETVTVSFSMELKSPPGIGFVFLTTRASPFK